MRPDDFDFELPEELIGLRPPSPRGAGRLLSVRPGAPHLLYDRRVADLPDMLRPNDILVLNDTKVLPVQLQAHRAARLPGGDSAKIGVTMHKRLADGSWVAFARPGKRLQAGDRLLLSRAASVQLVIREKRDGGEVIIASDCDKPLDAIIEANGLMPLPPYIASRRQTDERDRQDYQTVFAEKPGAAAAPTAGLHLTPELLERLAVRGVSHTFVTLHVGAGTFLPVKESAESHVMHAEWGEITAEAAAAINAARQQGGRVIACGTTALRLLETAATPSGEILPFRGETSIFIKPGHVFRGVDLLITNFHLPRSTLFMLVVAFSGLATMKAAYAHAIEAGYMFYSYGDSSLLHPENPR